MEVAPVRPLTGRDKLRHHAPAVRDDHDVAGLCPADVEAEPTLELADADGLRGRNVAS